LRFVDEEGAIQLTEREGGIGLKLLPCGEVIQR
jgi:hypothetical protein